MVYKPSYEEFRDLRKIFAQTAPSSIRRKIKVPDK